MDLIQILILLFAVQATFGSERIKTLYTQGYSYSQYFPLEGNLSPDKILRFSVRTSRDAHIVLAPSPEADGPVYEIVLGALNNTISHIRGRYPGEKEPSVSIRTVKLLNAQEYRNFWIRMKVLGRTSLIQVGLGDEDSPFQEWLDPLPLIPQYLSFRSGSVAEWKYGYADATYTVGISRDTRRSVVTATGYGQHFPLSEVVSHSDNSVTMYFTVQTTEEFQILLSPTISILGDVYEFGITGTGVYLSRQHLGFIKASYSRDGFFSEREKHGFWIRLTADGEIMLGTGASAVAVLNWIDPDPISPQFVSFTLYRPRTGHLDGTSFADLQYGLGPEYSLASQDCRPRWKDSIGQKLPPAAVRGGFNDKVELFVCRGSHEGQLLPGSFAAETNGKGQCYLVPYDWAVVAQTEFQVLTGCRLAWEKATFGHVPKGAIAGGSSASNSTLYVARVSIVHHITPGKLVPERLLAFIAMYNTIQRPFTHYEALVSTTSRR